MHVWSSLVRSLVFPSRLGTIPPHFDVWKSFDVGSCVYFAVTAVQREENRINNKL